jgi:hypothetical protein
MYPQGRWYVYWKTPRDLLMLFAAVTHLAEGLRLETLLTLKCYFLIGYTEINSFYPQ